LRLVLGVSPRRSVGVRAEHAPLVAVVVWLPLVVDIGAILIDDHGGERIAPTAATTGSAGAQLRRRRRCQRIAVPWAVVVIIGRQRCQGRAVIRLSISTRLVIAARLAISASRAIRTRLAPVVHRTRATHLVQ
jgi:hypothetical protein